MHPILRKKKEINESFISEMMEIGLNYTLGQISFADRVILEREAKQNQLRKLNSL